MNRVLIFTGLAIVLVSCKRGNPEIIALRNLTSQNIYFLISQKDVLTNPDEVRNIRPITFDPRAEITVEDKDEAERIRHNLFRYRIERDSMGTILTSESAEIFAHAVSIKEIIEDRYRGQLNIFIMTENDLLKYSDQEIIDKRKYKFFRTVTVEDIRSDSLSLEYF